MRQPICLTCEEGGHECLGYNHNQRRAVRSAPSKALKPRQIMPKGQGTSSGSVSPPTSSPGSASGSKEGSPGSSSSSELDVRSDSGSTNDYSLFYSAPSSSAEPYYPGSGTLVHRRDRSAKALARDYSLHIGSSSNKRRTTAWPPSLPHLFLMLNRIPSSPSEPILAYLNSPEFEVYASSTFNRILKETYFKPVKAQSEQLSNQLTLRMRNPFSRWVILLALKMSEAVSVGDWSQTESHVRWLGNLETAVRKKLSQCPTATEAEYLNADWLEVTILKTTFSQNSNVYAVHRNNTPMFLQTVYALPHLWPSGSDPTLIPLVNILGSEHHALAIFTLMDNSYAMAFGLPQQVEYETRTGPLPKDFLPHEYLYNAPTEFQVLLAEVNACRDHSPNARDWREVEYVLVHWESQVTQFDESWESWMIVAWLAVQESWRHMLLAYLYLAVCRYPSDDPRIQSCVTQILKVIGTVKGGEAEKKVPFFQQYWIVGVCTPHEKYRDIVRKKLSGMKSVGEGFASVLDHLWHGAGSDGRPITWDDYVRSREAMLPV